jgi:tetratricopeptide (TPR) repeat protein
MLKRLVILAGLVAAPGLVDAQTLQQAVISAQPTRYDVIQPKCEPFKGGHFKVRSGSTYLKSALESATNRDRLLTDAHRVITEAITTDNQAGSGAAWYWLARVYLYQGDVVGADSALARAQQVGGEACAEDMRSARVPVYAALIRPAGELMQADQSDSALVLLKRAASFYPEAPYAYQNMGIIYFNKKMYDSSAANFEKAIAAAETRAATDTAYASLRTQTTFNLAAVYQNSGRHQDAINALRRYLSWSPDDNDAKRALANSFRAVGQADSAQAIESQLLTSAGAEGAGAGAAVDVFDIGVKAFNDKNYDEAARAFQQALKDDPRYRDALFNLANTYLQLNNADSLIAVGARLVALDPMNENSLRLLARGYQIKTNADSTLKYVVMISELPFNIEISAFQPAPAQATLAGSATGREAKDVSEKPIAPAPVTLVFEFLDTSGTVVATQEVAVKALPSGEAQQFTVSAEGAGITAWRYKRK